MPRGPQRMPRRRVPGLHPWLGAAFSPGRRNLSRSCLIAGELGSLRQGDALSSGRARQLLLSAAHSQAGFGQARSCLWAAPCTRRSQPCRRAGARGSLGAAGTKGGQKGEGIGICSVTCKVARIHRVTRRLVCPQTRDPRALRPGRCNQRRILGSPGWVGFSCGSRWET